MYNIREQGEFNKEKKTIYWKTENIFVIFIHLFSSIIYSSGKLWLPLTKSKVFVNLQRETFTVTRSRMGEAGRGCSVCYLEPSSQKIIMLIIIHCWQVLFVNLLILRNFIAVCQNESFCRWQKICSSSSDWRKKSRKYIKFFYIIWFNFFFDYAFIISATLSIKKLKCFRVCVCLCKCVCVYFLPP